MKTVEETWALLDAAVAPLGPEAVGLSGAGGRILRTEVRADSDQPPFARSAMDGYLVRAGETAVVLRVTGEVVPGEPAKMPLPGSALRVFTGSAVPDEGAVVVMQEDVDREEGQVRLRAMAARENIRARGSQARRGDVLVDAGTPMAPGAIAVLAAVGVARPMVSPVIRAAHVTTGRELVECDTVPGEGEIRDSNSPMISALLCGAGAERVWHGRVDEDPAALAAAIEASLGARPHLLLISGGASVGDHDHTGGVLRESGFDLLVRGVATRPGKPLIVARRGGLLAFGMPGNPLSHFVSFHLFVRRAIDRLAGAAPRELVRLPVEDVAAIRANPRESWWPCRFARAADGLKVTPLPWKDSSDITALARAEGLLRVPHDGIGSSGVAEVMVTGNLDR
jgi:molybdopterin molybdotransferase